MSAVFPDCPFLPMPEVHMDWRDFSAHGEDRGAAFYLTALKYGQHLWRRGFAARSILCLDRAFGADLNGSEPELQSWPLPYRAMAWLLHATPPDVFIGNPRVHFQHFADRMNEPRRDLRRWRAWGCWEISRVVLPALPADPRHRVEEPSREIIAQQLQCYGLPQEDVLWRAALSYAEGLAQTRS